MSDGDDRAERAGLAEFGPIVESIRPLLAGKPHGIQSAVLADLLATWLAGHIVEGSPDETRKLRDALLAKHVSLVMALIKPNEAMIRDKIARGEIKGPRDF